MDQLSSNANKKYLIYVKITFCRYFWIFFIWLFWWAVTWVQDNQPYNWDFSYVQGISLLSGIEIDCLSWIYFNCCVLNHFNYILINLNPKCIFHSRRIFVNGLWVWGMRMCKKIYFSMMANIMSFLKANNRWIWIIIKILWLLQERDDLEN